VPTGAARATSVSNQNSTPAAQDYDLIVIGAGINGCGIARDAALRGLRALLLDKGDIAGGTTSWSSRLIHGGLRYLEHGELGLVRESLRERERLFRIAPHLVQPLPMMIPLYRGDRRGPLMIRAGMVAYDALSLDKSLPRHRMLDRAFALNRAPGLAAEGLRGAALYYDAQVTYAERLALENALDAHAHGADVRTYHEVDQILSQERQVVGVAGHDLLTGQMFRVTAPVVVNVAGPWVDEVLAEAPGSVCTKLIGGTKGSHVVVAPFPGAPRDALYAEARRDGRPFFIIPWNGLYLIGTTDIRYDGDLDQVVAEDWEIALLLEETTRILPAANLIPDDVLYSYAGVRPLPATPGAVESNITRRHIVRDHGATGGPRGLYSIIGGKLTTYRELAEQTVDLVSQQLGLPRVPSRTSVLPLPGGRADVPWPVFQESFLRDSPLPRQSSEHLLRVYGTRASSLLETASDPAMRTVIDPLSGAIAAEIPWAFQEEGARTLADVIARRTMCGLGSRAGVGADAAAARIARETLGWVKATADAEVDAYRQWVSRYRSRALDPASASTGALG
jgi:glycerol-3-phosphate dehydrogenase